MDVLLLWVCSRIRHLVWLAKIIRLLKGLRKEAGCDNGGEGISCYLVHIGRWEILETGLVR